jgi:RNA polymerase sigma-70 factor (ECF subfamily)
MTEETKDTLHNERHKKKQEHFLRLLMPVYEQLARFARAMVNNREDARDLISETVLAAFERFDNLRDDKAFISYLFTIARRTAKRRRTRDKLFGTYDQQTAEQIRDTQSQPEISIDVQFLYNALAKLPEKQREAIIFFEISGFSLEEIKEMQGGSLSGVKSRIARGREKLAQLLGAEGHADSLDSRPESINVLTAYSERKVHE